MRLFISVCEAELDEEEEQVVKLLLEYGFDVGLLDPQTMDRIKKPLKDAVMSHTVKAPQPAK